MFGLPSGSRYDTQHYDIRAHLAQIIYTNDMTQMSQGREAEIFFELEICEYIKLIKLFRDKIISWSKNLCVCECMCVVE